MSYTVSELFPGWYAKAVNRDVSPEETALRKLGIDAIVKTSDKATWIKFLDVYLGFAKTTTPSYNEVVSQVKGEDANFPVQSENLVRFLAGAAIMHRIKLDDNWLCPWLALALITSEILKPDAPQYQEFLSYAKFYYNKKCETQRALKENGESATKLNVASNVDIPGMTDTSSVGNKAHADAVAEAFAQVQMDLSATIRESNLTNTNLEALNKRLQVIAEETNVLWWLFAGFSETLNQPFTKVKKGLLPFIVATELSQISTVKPGLGKCQSILSKSLELGNHRHGKGSSIAEMIVATKDIKEKVDLLPDLQGLHRYAPFLSAAQHHRDYAETEWQVIYKTVVSLDLTQEISYETFAQQVYRELALIKYYRELN